LTEAGHHEARRLLRAHRLWETYLQHIGTPAAALHDQAHRLEHVHDEAAVDYLDDKLGHPLVDPHGAEIPEDFVHLVAGTEVNAALLREGRQGIISHVGDAAAGLELHSGQLLVAGPRTANQMHWTFHLDDGRTIELNHQQADALRVRLAS